MVFFRCQAGKTCLMTNKQYERNYMIYGGEIYGIYMAKCIDCVFADD